MKTQSQSDSKKKPIVINLPDEPGVTREGALFAYVVNANGSVIETTPFKGSRAQLASSSDALKGSRLFIGPKFPAQFPASRIDAYALAAAGAYQVSVSISRGGEISVLRLPPTVIVDPILRICEVQGNVTNTLIINGVPNSGPVCKAKVHICTVEWFFRWPIWLRPVVPPDIIAALKNSIVGLHAGLVVPPQPDPAPDLALASATRSAPTGLLSLKAAGLPQAPALKPLPVGIEAQILSATPDTIHEVVSRYSGILYPYFCRWPIFWPWFYRVVEQEVVYTDCNGHFDGWLISVGAPPPQENVYVWVEANIDGTWVTVYNPPFPCATKWDYACGTDINISLTNPAIMPCNCESTVVDGSAWFTAIGQYGIATNIQQDETSVYSPAGIPNVGCTNLVDPHGNQLCPFGGSLGLYLAFGPTLPATHYRWTWTYIMDSSLNPIVDSPPNVITGSVARPYLWPLADGGWESSSIPLLDTDSGGNIAYQIPNYDVATYPGVSPEAEWVSFNFQSALLDSTKISSGYVVRFDLELMNKNASGLFETVSVPVATFQVSKDTNAAAGYDGSVPAPYTANGSGNNYLTLDPATPGNALMLSVKVRVDNSPVTADIKDAWLLDASGVPIPGGNSNACGFIQFSETSQDVRLMFAATEPFNFATFSYGVVRGASGAAIPGASGYVFESAPPFTLSGGLYSDAFSVATLLGPCTRAAFGETLGVASLATDGSGALSETGYPYYASEINAFALTGS
jgi:hypothetical protein